mmetsp:Transcript_26365/g.74157  ORF Transcript_26365/g.74157 Transcript_26365/m.74157 type:complete len:224 (+) Transcript_26365:566-1237(+)
MAQRGGAGGRWRRQRQGNGGIWGEEGRERGSGRIERWRWRERGHAHRELVDHHGNVAEPQEVNVRVPDPPGRDFCQRDEEAHEVQESPPIRRHRSVGKVQGGREHCKAEGDPNGRNEGGQPDDPKEEEVPREANRHIHQPAENEAGRDGHDDLLDPLCNIVRYDIEHSVGPLPPEEGPLEHKGGEVRCRAEHRGRCPHEHEGCCLVCTLQVTVFPSTASLVVE